MGDAERCVSEGSRPAFSPGFTAVNEDENIGGNFKSHFNSKPPAYCLFPDKASSLLQVPKCVNVLFSPLFQQGNKNWLTASLKERKLALPRRGFLDQALRDFFFFFQYPMVSPQGRVSCSRYGPRDK